MNDTVNSGTFLTPNPSTITTRLVIADINDRPEVLKALAELDTYARSTGSLGGGGTAVEAFGANLTKVVAWISPADAQSIQVKVRPARTTWAIARTPDEKPTEWMPLSEGAQRPEHRHAVEAARIIRGAFPSLSGQRLGS